MELVHHMGEINERLLQKFRGLIKRASVKEGEVKRGRVL